MAPLAFTAVEFNQPPPGIEELRQRLEERCGCSIVARRRESSTTAVRRLQLHGSDPPEPSSDGEFWLAELPEAKIEIRTSQLCETPPRTEFFEKLGWTAPGSAAPYWQVVATGESTLQSALLDMLRQAGGRVRDSDDPPLSTPVNIAELRQRLANARRYRWIGLAAVIAYGLLVVALIPIWFPVTLGYAAPRIRRFVSRQRWLKRSGVDALHAAEAADFARYVRRHIGRSGGKIGAPSRLSSLKLRCRVPAAIWAARQEAGPWDSAEAVVDGLCHTDSSTPWHIQFDDRPPEPLRDWLDGEMRA